MKIKTNFLHKQIVHILLIVLFGSIAYSNSFHVPFLFDDNNNIVRNPVVKNIDFFINPSKVKDFMEYHALKMRYIGYLSFAINYKLNGLDVTGYHILNLIIHIFNAILIYLLIIYTFKTPVMKLSDIKYSPYAELIAVFSSLFFVAHPIQTQAITYIVQRFASLATMFYLLSLFMYLKARLVQTSGAEVKAKVKFFSTLTFYLISLISAILAMKTKEIAFTLPVIIVLYEFLFFEGKIKKRILYLIPLLFTMLIIPLGLIGTDKPVEGLVSAITDATRVDTGISRWDYLFTQFRVIVTYIRLLFFPVNQSLDYDYPVYHSFFDHEVFLSFLFLSSILGIAVFLAFYSRFRYKLIPFGIFWFFITLSVESGVIPILDVIVEHRVYLPSAGFFISITTFLFIFTNRLKGKWHLIKKAVIPASVLITVIFSVATFKRNIVWQDEERLWEDVINKSPESPKGYNGLASIYIKKGKLDGALKLLRISSRLDPFNQVLNFNLGNIYWKKGLIDKAIEYYQLSLALQPDNPYIHFNLGLAYSSKGWNDKAAEHFNKANMLNPHMMPP